MVGMKSLAVAVTGKAGTGTASLLLSLLPLQSQSQSLPVSITILGHCHYHTHTKHSHTHRHTHSHTHLTRPCTFPVTLTLLACHPTTVCLPCPQSSPACPRFVLYGRSVRDRDCLTVSVFERVNFPVKKSWLATFWHLVLPFHLTPFRR